MTNPIVIFGSANSKGKTRSIIDQMVESSDISVVDLHSLNITPFDYEYNNRGDDYLPLMQRVLKHDLIVLATPVYWYSVSIEMKIFLDRLTDILKHHKDLLEQIRGKRIFVIATFGSSIPRGFEDMFEQICDYMEMQYDGCSFIHTGENDEYNANNALEIAKARKVMEIE